MLKNSDKISTWSTRLSTRRVGINECWVFLGLLSTTKTRTLRYKLRIELGFCDTLSSLPSVSDSPWRSVLLSISDLLHRWRSSPSFFWISHSLSVWVSFISISYLMILYKLEFKFAFIFTSSLIHLCIGFAYGFRFVGFDWAMAFNYAFGLALKLRMWVSNWLWILVVAFNLAMAFSYGFRYSFGLWLSVRLCALCQVLAS